MVPEVETIRTCRRLAKRGFLFGGSTGTVVSGALDWLSRNDTGELTTVAISPDLGEHYLETVYTDEWVEENYGDDVLAHDEREPQTEPATDRVGDPIAIVEG
jgi:cysteine synthase A